MAAIAARLDAAAGTYATYNDEYRCALPRCGDLLATTNLTQPYGSHRIGCAARCEATALPRSNEPVSLNGLCPWSGLRPTSSIRLFVIQKAEPESGRSPNEKVMAPARQSHRRTSGGKAGQQVLRKIRRCEPATQRTLKLHRPGDDVIAARCRTSGLPNIAATNFPAIAATAGNYPASRPRNIFGYDAVTSMEQLMAIGC